jgi:hypothetical protein
MFDSQYRKVKLVVWEHGKKKRSIMMKKLMQEIQPFTINLELFSRYSVTLISGKKNLCTISVPTKRKEVTKMIQYTYTCLSSLLIILQLFLYSFVKSY